MDDDKELELTSEGRRGCGSILREEGLGDTSGILGVKRMRDEDNSCDDSDDSSDEEELLSHLGCRMRVDGEVRFRIDKNDEEVFDIEANDEVISSSIGMSGFDTAKRNSLLFPAYSILKNSPLVQPAEFKALKHIEKISHSSRHNSDSEDSEENADNEGEDEKKDEINEEGEENKSSKRRVSPKNRSDGSSHELGDVKFIGDAILDDSNSYKFRYNPEENPKRPSIKRGNLPAA